MQRDVDALPLPLAVAGTVLIVIARYFITSGGFAIWTRRRGITAGPADPVRRRRQILAEIRWSLVSAIIYGVPAGLVLEGSRRFGLTQIDWQWSGLGDALWFVPSILLYLFLHDSWFYWTHRAMHHPRLFRIHAIHHASKPPTAWAAMSFAPTEALSGAIFIPALVFLVPIHIAALAIVLTVATVMGVTNHMGWEMFPARWVNGWFGRHVITASHHEQHHKRYTCNYGLYFRFWDQLCRTDTGLASFGRPRAADSATIEPAGASA